MKLFVSKYLPPTLLFLILVVCWQIAVTVWQIPRYLVPSPLTVAEAVRDNFWELFGAVRTTLFAALSGFLASMILGCLTAFVFSQSKIIERSFTPYAIFLQTVPIVAIAPLIIIWFGTGFRSVIIISCIISIFPVITTATAGLTRIDQNLIDLFRLNGSTHLQTLIKLRLPHAVPDIVTGAKTAGGLSVIGAIVGEFFAGYGTKIYGLGYLVIASSGQLNTSLLFACILASTALGIAIFALITIIGDKVLARWQEL